jgi:hypothetical protein
MCENPQWRTLLPRQEKAIAHVRELAVHASTEARNLIRAVLARAGLSESAYDEAIQSIRSHGRVALHFHPERLDCTRGTVAAGLLQAGIYKSQFETGLSSGSPSAFPGGERDLWESRLFGRAYHGADALAAGRPKYGALDVMPHPDGPAPRFGSCYFLLRPAVSQRSTFTFGGSHEPMANDRTGTLGLLDPMMAPLLAELELGQGAFGMAQLTVPELLAELTHGISKPRDNPQARPLGRSLDSFIEVQVHGELHLAEDVDRLVADPCFEDGPVGDTLEDISSRYDIPLSWHPGFTLPVAEVPEVFRDYPIRPLAERAAGEGILDAAKIGALANSVVLEPNAWRGWASSEDILTQFRRLWHVLVLTGTPNIAR